MNQCDSEERYATAVALIDLQKERIEEVEAWAIARDNEQGEQIAKRDKRIKELESNVALRVCPK